MRLNKIYTRNGDGGQTQLVGGQSVQKSDDRLDAFGTVDELNAHIGMLTCRLRAMEVSWAQEMSVQLQRIQDKLFDLGSDLATPPDSPYKRTDLVEDTDIEGLESWLDELNEPLGELKSFVLPGSGELNAWAHLARVVCRRAERQACALAEITSVDAGVLRYLNRLSDVLFVVSRSLSQRCEEKEVLWQRPL
jgi:cob(I)alamin adenosyltransferase